MACAIFATRRALTASSFAEVALAAATRRPSAPEEPTPWLFHVESLLGLQRRGNQPWLRPLLPRDWKKFDLHYRFGGSIHAIDLREAESAETAGSTVDGSARTAAGIPLALVDDGKVHTVPSSTTLSDDKQNGDEPCNWE